MPFHFAVRTTTRSLYPNIVGLAFRSPLEQYGLNKASNFCPEGAVPTEQQAAFYAVFGGAMGYAYYAYLSNGTPGPRSPRTLNDARDNANRPSLLFSDVSRYFSTGVPVHTNHPDPSQPINVLDTGLGWNLHVAQSRGINNGYLDGHVEWIAFNRLDLAVYYITPYDHSYHWKR